MEIKQLPPTPAPKLLTARHGISNLEEHFLAFLCANNKGGFKESDIRENAGPLLQLLLLPLHCHSRSIDQLKKDAKRIKKFSEKVIKHQTTLDLIAKVMGYKVWNVLLQFVDHSGKVVNINYGKDDETVIKEITQ